MKGIDDYIKFFKDKPLNPQRTNEFVKEYQQEKGGYISFASAIEKGDKDNIKCESNQREYCKHLLDMNEQNKAVQIIAELLGIDCDEVEKMNPMGVTIDKEQGEPNQKWHLFISWFGWKKYENKEPRIVQASCPELWLWMCEASGKFEEDELNEIFESAKTYRESHANYNDAKKKWNDVRNKFREELEKRMD